MSKILVKLLDVAVFPAALIIAGKACGVMLMNVIYRLSWDVESVTKAIVVPHIVYPSYDQAIAVASYSNLIMYIVIFIGIAYIILKAFYLHDSHISPQLVLKLARVNLLKMVQTSFEVYHQAFVWFAYQVIATIFIVINYINNITYGWVAISTTVVTLLTFWILVKDVEMELQKKHLFNAGKS
uniref:Uncharacterized protein n=1 Tax=candidate division CPR3 bacterium TaxID=2268181 RepID=A0A7C5URN5_UNCC3